jgi:hypothetical protein
MMLGFGPIGNGPISEGPKAPPKPKNDNAPAPKDAA